jgi:Xaa-Pro aminopeptidase
VPLPSPTPVFPLELLRARRAEVQRLMRERGGGVLVLPAMPQTMRNWDVEHPYRADSDLFWLTGFEEPEAVAVLSASGDRPFTLFVRPRDAEKEVWNGRRAGVDGARDSFGADEALPIDKLGEGLLRLLGNSKVLWCRLGGFDGSFDTRICQTLSQLRQRARAGIDAPSRIEDPAQLLHELRLRKDRHELEALRRAVELTRRGHLAAMRAGRPGAHESDLQGLLEREYRRDQGRGPGYYPIVAAGVNATVLHYVENRARIGEGELVLIDSGAEVELYTADVTRTFPASGRFTEVQRRAYQIVLEAADAVIAHARPGATIDGLHQLAVERLTAGMLELGLLTGTVEENVKDQHFRRYYMHRTSHWLGLDVHDAGRYRIAEAEPTSRPLEPGMVFTVEPGLYVAHDDERAPAALRGLGIRIEDDVLVTAQGCEVLTAAIPRTVAEVEAACAR